MLYKFNSSKLEYERLFTFSLVIKVMLIFLVFISIGFTLAPRNIKNITEEEKLIILRESSEFSEDKLVDMIRNMNFKFPHIILAQSYQETGYFKSIIFKENNNLFGMKESYRRITTSKGSNRNHAFYDNWKESVIDYALYQSTYLSSIKNEDEYFEYLKLNYAEDVTYVDRLKSIIDKQKLKNKF